MSDREDREDLAMIIAIENGDGERGPFEADYAAADAIIAAGWKVDRSHEHNWVGYVSDRAVHTIMTAGWSPLPTGWQPAPGESR